MEGIVFLTYFALFSTFNFSFELLTTEDFESSFHNIIKLLEDKDSEELKTMLIKDLYNKKENFKELNKKYLIGMKNKNDSN